MPTNPYRLTPRTRQGGQTFPKKVKNLNAMKRLGVPDGAVSRFSGVRLISALESLQDMLTQSYRIPLATLGKFDDFPGNRVGFGLIAIFQTKHAANIRIGACHRRDRFRLESPVFEQAVDGHQRFARLSQVNGPD
jgi:hypothetical protein